MITDTQLKRLIWSAKAECFYIRALHKNGQSTKVRLDSLERIGKKIRKGFKEKLEGKTETLEHGKVIWLKGAA